MKPICIIPVRSGSKGLPDKNMLFLDEKPLIFHTIDAALASGQFEPQHIIVSTDSELYRDICATRGVQVVMRRPELASDTATTFEVLEDLLQAYDDEQVFVLLQATSPFRQAEQITQALAQYHESENVEHIVSCVAVDKHPRLFSTLSPEGYLQDIVGVDKGYRRQDAQPLYMPNGAIFISKKANYLQHGSFFTEKTQAFLMDQATSLDIDSHEDFIYAIGKSYFDYAKREIKNKPFYQQQFEGISQRPAENGVIIGDSRMLDIVLPGFKNTAIGGLTLATALENMELILVGQPRVALVSIGVNDIIVKYSIEVIQQHFTQLFEELHKRGIRIYCTTIAYAVFRETVNSRTVQQLNDWLRTYCEEQAIPLLDINTVVSSDNKLRYDYTTDGLHFNPTATQLLQAAYGEFVGA